MSDLIDEYWVVQGCTEEERNFGWMDWTDAIYDRNEAIEILNDFRSNATPGSKFRMTYTSRFVSTLGEP